MSESMDSMFSYDDNIVETVSSLKSIEKDNIALLIASSKQTEYVTTKKGRKRRNADISDIYIKLSCKKRKATSPCDSNSTIVNQVSNRRPNNTYSIAYN